MAADTAPREDRLHIPTVAHGSRSSRSRGRHRRRHRWRPALAASHHAIEREILTADLVIGAVLVHGAKAPKLVSNAQVKMMKPGSVLVDIAIDQGGCFEDSRATTHAEPTFSIHESVFYCVANMPGAVPVTSTYALTNATLPYALAIAKKGWRQACAEDTDLAKGLNVHDGEIYYAAVADAHGYQSVRF